MSTTPQFESLCQSAKRAVRHRDFAAAIQLFRQALEIDEASADAHEGLAAACFLSGDFDGAIRHYTRVTQLKPRDGKALINIGAIYNRQGEYAKAADVLRRGIAKEQKSSEGFYNLGIAMRKTNQLPLAVSAYREAVRLKPDMAEAHQNLANVYLELGQDKPAIEHYRKALEIDPDFERARRGLARAEEHRAAAKANINPFGRLVEAPRKETAPTTKAYRVLDPEQRVRDRQTVGTLADELQQVTREFLDQLKQQLEARLALLHRSVAEGSQAKFETLAAFDEFRAAVALTQQPRAAMKGKIEELRRHEAEMAG